MLLVLAAQPYCIHHFQNCLPFHPETRAVLLRLGQIDVRNDSGRRGQNPLEVVQWQELVFHRHRDTTPHTLLASPLTLDESCSDPIFHDALSSGLQPLDRLKDV